MKLCEVFGLVISVTGKNLSVIIDGRHITIYSPKVFCSISVGDYIRASGAYVDKDRFDIADINVLRVSPVASKEWGKKSSHNYHDSIKLEKLLLRSLVEQFIATYMGDAGFLRVTSPSIVGPWPDGATRPFKLNYYGEDARLSISNMMYQQVMMMHGFGRLYEIGKSFREETPSRPGRLAEFTTFDIGLVTNNLREIELVFEEMAIALLENLQKQTWNYLKLPDSFWFERIEFRELLDRCGLNEMPGAQLPPIVREYITNNYKSYLWVTGFPQYSRPFYAKSIDGFCCDSQLWFAGKIYVGAASLMEDDVSSYTHKIQERKHVVSSYDDYISHTKTGIPPITQLAIGLERMLATWFGADAADFTWFPRYGKNIPF